MSGTPQNTGGFFAVERQHVKYANVWVKKEGVLERPDPSWSNFDLDKSRLRHVRTFSRYRCPLQNSICLDPDVEKEVLTLHISTG